MILGTNMARAVKGTYIYYVTLIKDEGVRQNLTVCNIGVGGYRSLLRYC